MPYQADSANLFMIAIVCGLMDPDEKINDGKHQFGVHEGTLLSIILYVLVYYIFIFVCQSILKLYKNKAKKMEK